MSRAPGVGSGDMPMTRDTHEMSHSESDVPNFHMTDQPRSTQVSPSASPRIRISFKGDQGRGPSESDSPASMNRDAPSTQPGDSNSASTSSRTLAPSVVSIPATTLNMPIDSGGSGSISQPVPLSPSKRPFSFRDVRDINEDSQIRIQSARIHHDRYDRKRTCACCEKRPEPEVKQSIQSTASHTETVGKDKDKTHKNKPANGTNSESPFPSSSSSSSLSCSSRAKQPKSSGWSFCGLCIAFRNLISPEDAEYRCQHGRPCTAPNHRHTTGCV